MLCPCNAAIKTLTNNLMERELAIRPSSLRADYGAKTKTTTKLFSRVIWKSNLHIDMQVDVPFLGRGDVLRAMPWNAGTVLDFLSNVKDAEPSFLVLPYLSGFILADLAKGPVLLSAGYPGNVFHERFIWRWKSLKLRCSTNIAWDFSRPYLLTSINQWWTLSMTVAG